MKNLIRIPIYETFSSIQGEGRNIGKLQYFIRVAGCDLNCNNFCDTSYSWKVNKKTYKTLEQIIKGVQKSKLHSICITGGEPLLYATEIIHLITELNKLDKYFYLLQTNGTIYNETLFNLIDCIALDVKSPSFTGNKDLSLLKNTIRSFNTIVSNKNNEIKVVIFNEIDLNFAIEVSKRISTNHPTGIPMILQPGYIEEEYEDLVLTYKQFLTNVSRRKHEFYNLENIQILPQLHKILYGNQRGI